MTPLRLAFMGSPDFSVPALRALHAAGHDIAMVYCQLPWSWACRCARRCACGRMLESTRPSRR